MPYLLLVLGVVFIIWGLRGELRSSKSLENPVEIEETSFNSALRQTILNQISEQVVSPEASNTKERAAEKADEYYSASKGRYQEAIHALKNGSTMAEIEEAFGLRKGEAELLTRLYQNTGS